MDFLSSFFIAIGLSMDSLAVCISGGIFMKTFLWKTATRIALIMGIFQGGMTLLGWTLGTSFSTYISAYDHWIAFTLLTFLGSKMIYEAFSPKESSFTSLSFKTLITLGIATSIDALAIGVSIAFLKVSIYSPATIIGLITFTLSLLGVYIGYRFGKLKKINIEFIGGLILVIIGIKILIEHLSA